LLFLIASCYLIGVAAWFVRQNKIQASTGTFQTLKNEPDLQEEFNQQESIKKPIQVDLNKEQNTSKISSDFLSSSLIKQPIPNLLPPENTNNSNLIKNNFSLPNIPPSPPISPVSSGSIIPVKPQLSQPSKIPIPPPPKPAKPITSVPILDSDKNNIQNKNSNSPSISYLPPADLSVPNYNNVLVGLIELEDKSTIALFKVNKLTEKVRIGEEIGVSGWSLLSINQNQAVVTKKGKTIRVTIGEKF
jgi:hypothetical protein